MVTDRASSHANLALEYQQADQDRHVWQAFLGRAQTHAADKASNKVADFSAHGLGHSALNPIDNNDFLLNFTLPHIVLEESW
jgi:hypothetical protein